MNDAQTNESRPKPLGADENPVERGVQLAKLVASDQPGESAGAMRMLGLHAAKHGFSKRLSETLAAEIPHLTNGGGKTRAELETRIVELERQNEDLFTTNQALGEQNEAIFNENTRLRRPSAGERIAGAMRRLTDIFSPAASADGSAPRKGFLRTAFAASVPGALAAGAFLMGVPLPLQSANEAAVYVAIAGGAIGAGAFGYAVCVADNCPDDALPASILHGFMSAGLSKIATVIVGYAPVFGGSGDSISAVPAIAAAAVVSTALPTLIASAYVDAARSNPFRTAHFSPGKVFAGMMTGAALSAALVFGAASYGHAPEKSAAAATVTPDRAQHQNGFRPSP